MKNTIVIVGLLPGQTHRVEKACGKVSNLKFVSGKQVSAKFPCANFCVLMLKFLGHRWSNAAFRQFPRESVVLHLGGLKQLAKTLDKLGGSTIRR